jgi:hypothetical protein
MVLATTARTGQSERARDSNRDFVIGLDERARDPAIGDTPGPSFGDAR